MSQERSRIRHGRRTVTRVASGTAILTLTIAGAALAAFPQDPPNDPGFAPAEAPPAATTCLTTSGDAQEHYLFSKIPQCTPNAQDPEGSAGMFVDRVWRDFTTGRGATVAYIEGGINWHAGDAPELANRVFLNAGELPAPTTPVNDGVLSAKDYADTGDSNGNGLVDPEDIIVRFSNGVDNDHNGYTDDISGWDFYNDQNDPATLDSTYDHANGQMKQAAAETNNGIGDAGVCPDCRVMPVKAGAEALDRTDDLAQAWLYATDLDADVIISTTADLGYSSFMNQAVNYAWNHGTAMVESSNDFNSTDHQGGMFHPHVLPGNGMVANSHGMEFIPGTTVVQNNSTTTYRARSGYTSWGTHNMFTVATTGGTTSESTPTVGGVLALVLAEGKQAAAQHRISSPLTPDEAIQVLRATASDVAAPVPAPVNWPAKPGFDLQYGYGRPNVYKAAQAVSQGNIPPEAWIEKPRWYALFDPTRISKVKVTGHVAARRSSGARWSVQFAPGAEPADSDFINAGAGQLKPGKHVFNGKLGTIDLNRIPASFWNKAFTISQRKELETNEAYTVTIRLRVFDANGRMGEERRSIAVHHDPSLRSGFPRKIGPGGESQPVLADLRGTGKEALIFGDSDGRVHALNGSGRELPGFPVFTNRTQVTRSHKGVNPGHEPLFTNLAVGDLDHDGRQWIVGTSSAGRVYVWDSKGHRRAGWPKALDTGVSKPSIPRPASPFTRLPIMGATAPPVLADLDGNGTLEIVQAGWDGRLHAWRATGQNQPGWPVEVTLPPGTTPPSGQVLVNDHKLDLPPALAQLDSDPQPELVQRTQYAFTPGSGLQVPNGGRSNVVAYNGDGSRVPNWLISATAIAFYYGSAQEFITEGVSNPVTADVTGDGKSEIAFAPGIFSPTELHNTDGSLRSVYGPNPLISFAGAVGSLAAIQQTLQGNLPVDIPVNFTTSGAFGNFGGGLAYTEPGSGAATVAASLLLPGSGLPINSYARAFGASTGAPLAGFPTKLQGLDFLGAPAIADVSGDGQPELLIGGDSSALHAYSATTGAQASGFPKFMTGWEVFGPSVGDIDGNGDNEVAITTREGYVMVWNTPGRASSNQWWSARHDQHNSGQYGVDAQSPGVARNARIQNGELRFKAPGDDWYVGKVDHYRVQLTDRHRHTSTKNVNPSSAAGGVQKVALEPGTRKVRVRAVDDAGNVSRWVSVRR
jgi:hypothetical protein